MAKAQEVGEMKEWQLIYDGNLESATRTIELTKDNPCIYYSVEDIQKLIAAAMGFVKYNTTYCNVKLNVEQQLQKINKL